ncbi:MAG: trypsin-like peptidase domain-containing protein [Chloroflexi bacterium]|nr:trypsin-like peptidase domain-containing protein [Chloroflexota bacterium]
MPPNSFDPFEKKLVSKPGVPEPLLRSMPGSKPPGPSRITRLRERAKQMRARARSFLPLLLGMFIAFGAMFAYDFARPATPRLTEQKIGELVASAMASATPPPSRGSLAYEQIAPSLVRIEAQLTAGDDKRAFGTGVVVDEGGAILSSYHIVKGAIKIEVVFYDGTRSDATVIAKVEEQDTVVLRARTPPAFLIPAVLGNPGSLRVGDEAFVVGNPFGIRNSMSAGVISGLNRNFKSPKTGATLSNLIQFDAAANPGNSGGPLMNSYGEVVGIVTALYNPTDQEVFVGIAFAVPIDAAGGAMGSPPW